MLFRRGGQLERTRTVCAHCVNETRGAVAVLELALVLPLLLIIFVAAVDFARVFYSAQVIADCARTAALYSANPDLADKTGYESAVDLALICAADLDPQPTITIARGKNSLSQEYVEAIVTQRFKLVFPFVFNSEYQITRTARARLYPAALEENFLD